MNDPLTDEDAETIVLAAKLSGQNLTYAVHMFSMTLPSGHSALYSVPARRQFWDKVIRTQKQYDQEEQNNHTANT